MFSHLLIPLDGSPFGDEALAYALSLAQKFDSKITLLHVTSQQWEGEMSAELPEAESLSEWVRSSASQLNLKEQKDQLTADGYQVNALVMKGKPIGDVILKAAATEGVDTIIMSTHGMTGWRRHLYGSVAESVIGHSKIPVLLIRPSPKENS